MASQLNAREFVSDTHVASEQLYVLEWKLRDLSDRLNGGRNSFAMSKKCLDLVHQVQRMTLNSKPLGVTIKKLHDSVSELEGRVNAHCGRAAAGYMQTKEGYHVRVFLDTTTTLKLTREFKVVIRDTLYRLHRDLNRLQRNHFIA